MTTHTPSFSSSFLLGAVEATTQKNPVFDPLNIVLVKLEQLDPIYPAIDPKNFGLAAMVKVRFDENAEKVSFLYTCSSYDETIDQFAQEDLPQRPMAEATPVLAACHLLESQKEGADDSAALSADSVRKLTVAVNSDPEVKQAYDLLRSFEIAKASKGQLAVEKLRTIWSMWPHVDLNAACRGDQVAMEKLRSLPFSLQKEAYVILAATPTEADALGQEARNLIKQTLPESIQESSFHYVARDSLNESTLQPFSMEAWASSIKERAEAFDGFLALPADFSLSPLEWVMSAKGREDGRARALSLDINYFNSWVAANIATFPTERPSTKGSELAAWLLRAAPSLPDSAIEAAFRELAYPVRTLAVRASGAVNASLSAALHRILLKR